MNNILLIEMSDGRYIEIERFIGSAAIAVGRDMNEEEVTVDLDQIEKIVQHLSVILAERNL